MSRDYPSLWPSQLIIPRHRRRRSLLRWFWDTYALWFLFRHLLKRSFLSSDMNEHCYVGCFSCRQTWRNVTLSIIGKDFMLTNRDDTASVGVVHQSNAITGVPEKFLDTIDGPDVLLDSTLCTPDLELAHVDLRCEACFLTVLCSIGVGSLLLDEISVPYSLSSDVAWSARR